MNSKRALTSCFRRISVLALVLILWSTMAGAQRSGWTDFIGQWKLSSGNELITISANADPAKQLDFDFSALNLKAWVPVSRDAASGKFVFKMVPQLSQMKKDVPEEINSKALGAGLTWYLEINLERPDKDTSHNLLKISFYKGRINWIKKDPPVFSSISNYPAPDASEAPYKAELTATIITKIKCDASKNTHEEKIAFEPVIQKLKQFNDLVNVKGSPLEVKVNVNATMSVKQGEECCSPDKPPVTYSEFKGGVEGSIEINYRVAGIPDLSTKFDLWVFQIEAEFQAKIFIGGAGKLSVGVVGKFYNGILGSDYHPECPQNCKYLTIKHESYLRAGGKLLGKFAITEPYVEFDKARFKQVNELVKAEASAELTGNFGVEIKGTYGLDDYCIKPELGFHGSIFLGKFKGVAKFKVQLGPIKFDYTYERIWWDGYEIKYPFH